MKNLKRVVSVSGSVMVCALVLSAVSFVGADEYAGIEIRTETASGYQVSGSVVGSDGGAMSGVRIALSGDGIDQKAVSDADGVFEFRDVPPGDYTLLLEKKGSKKVKRQITVADGDLDLGTISMQ